VKNNTVLEKLFGSKKVELPGGWRRLHIGQRHDFRPHQILFGMSGHGGRGCHGFGYLWETEKKSV